MENSGVRFVNNRDFDLRSVVSKHLHIRIAKYEAVVNCKLVPKNNAFTCVHWWDKRTKLGICKEQINSEEHNSELVKKLYKKSTANLSCSFSKTGKCKDLHGKNSEEETRKDLRRCEKKITSVREQGNR